MNISREQGFHTDESLVTLGVYIIIITPDTPARFQSSQRVDIGEDLHTWFEQIQNPLLVLYQS